MAKKHFGKFIAFAAIAGAAFGSISYFLRYKSFHKELDEEFHEFEDEFDETFDEFTEPEDESAPTSRNYVSLKSERHVTSQENNASLSEPSESATTTQVQDNKKQSEYPDNLTNSENNSSKEASSVSQNKTTHDSDSLNDPTTTIVEDLDLNE